MRFFRDRHFFRIPQRPSQSEYVIATLKRTGFLRMGFFSGFRVPRSRRHFSSSEEMAVYRHVIDETEH